MIPKYPYNLLLGGKPIPKKPARTSLFAVRKDGTREDITQMLNDAGYLEVIIEWQPDCTISLSSQDTIEVHYQLSRENVKHVGDV